MRQFQIMTTTAAPNQSTGASLNVSANSGNIQTSTGANVQSPQVVIQQQGAQTTSTNIVGQSQTIRKIGSSNNLASLQKVQVINRPGIQIVQTAAQRLGKPASTTTITTLPAGGNGATSATGSTNPIQFSQVFQTQQKQPQPQQQGNKLQTNSLSQSSK